MNWVRGVKNIVFPRIRKRAIVAQAAIVLAAAAIGFYAWLSDKYVVPILMYHHVRTTDGSTSDTVSPETFQQQLAFLRDHHYNVISLDDLIEAKRKNRVLPRNSVVITFDDGYDNNYTEAFPRLRTFQLPATMFVSPRQIGEPGFMTWAQLKEMQEAGIEIGSHGLSQAYLPDLSPEAQLVEILGSKEILEGRLGKRIEKFAYPIGGFSETVKDYIRRTGYEAAVTTNRGYDRLNRDLYELKRIKIKDDDTSVLVLKVKLSGYYNLFRSLKQPF